VLRIVERTDLDEEEAVAVLHRRLAAAGVDAALVAAGCQDGDTVRIGSAEFTFAADAMSSVPRPPRRSRR
jgi:GTP-binding protein